MSDNANLRVVPQITDADDSCDIEHLKSWIQTLPANDSGQASKMLHSAIKNLCLKNISMSDRLAALDILRLSVKSLSDDLSDSLLEQGMSLNESTNATASFVQSLHSMLIDSYKRCVVFLQKKQTDTRIQIAQVIHRSLFEALALLLLKYQLYNDIPSELWSEINHLYSLAETLELQNMVVEDSTDQFVKHSTILQLMIQAQLLALSQPYALKRKDLALVFSSLEFWSNYVYFDRMYKEEALFQTDLRSNKHAGYVKAGIEKDSIRYLDVSKLIRNLFEILHHNTPKPGFVLAQGMGSNLLAHLCHCWGKHLKREFHRTQTDAPVSVCLGMFASHFYARNQKKITEIYKHISLENAHNTQLEEQLETAYPSYSMSIRNIGFGGLCLSSKAQLPDSVGIGELICVCFNQNDDWLLGMIRWIHIHPNQTAEIGVSVLSSDLDVGFIRLAQPEKSKPAFVPAIRLVTTDCKHSDMVIAARGCIDKESLIEAHFMDKKGSFCLKKAAYSCTNIEFDVFYLQTPKEDSDYLEMI